MIIQRLFSDKKKSEQDKKKGLIGLGVAGAGVLAGKGAEIMSDKQRLKANRIRQNHINEFDSKTAPRIAKKVGVKNIGPHLISDNKEKIAKAEEMANRYDRVVKRAIDKKVKNAKRWETGSKGLALASAGSIAYAAKKAIDAKKAEDKEKKDDNSKK